MPSNNETGHTKNVATFQELLAVVSGLGTSYNPSKELLKLSNLTAVKTSAEAVMSELTAKNTVYNTKVNERHAAFEGLRIFSTRLINAIQTTDASPQTVKDAKGFNRKIQGKRASKIEKPTDPNTPAPVTISSSQLSYDLLIQHLSGLVSVLQSVPSYAPNEEDLKITSLNARITNLTNKNYEVSAAYAELSQTRLNRNKTLYAPGTGLVPIALEVKKYIRSIFGSRSPETAQLKRINFKNYKI